VFMFYISKEDQTEVHKRYSDIREISKNFFIEYWDNYLTTAKIAEHYEIRKELAYELIKLGKSEYEKEKIK